MNVDDLDTSVNNLAGRVTSLDQKVTRLESGIRRRNAIIAWFLAAIIVVLLATVPAMIKVSFDNRDAIKANNRKFCPFIGILVPGPGAAEPTTERGREIARDAARISREFNCS